MKSHKEYYGIYLGALYALVFRVLGGLEIFQDAFTIYSITFIWIVPLLVGIIPILVAREQMRNAPGKQFLYPLLSGLLFAIIAFTTGLEDVFCLFIIAIPFVLGAGIIGILIGTLLDKQDSKKATKDKNLYSLILLIPLFLNPLESMFFSPQAEFEVAQNIMIHASKENFWANFIEVPEIIDTEYEYSFFNYMGIPRPVKSKLETIDGKEYRIGYFSDDLKLAESISEIDSLNYVVFKIHMDKSQLRDLPTDKHILQSEFFSFKNISYTLIPSENGSVILSLTCKYNIKSKMNAYANFWAEWVIGDFENNLLKALKSKIERQ